MLSVFIILSILSFSFAADFKFTQDLKFRSSKEHATETPKCGYESCNPTKDGMINVHLVPHTHDDVGWLKTVDQYYYGSNKANSPAGVQYILDSVFKELRDDTTKLKRFIYVEIAFFKRWWDEQNDHTRHAVKKLVNEGRLEFILGAWSMNDEAATHYNAIIDQHTLGFQFLNETFGVCGRPRVAWQIDPFGHSREQASLFAQMGYDGLFFGRLDYQDKDTRLKNKTMEMVWMASENLGSQSALFTGALYSGYGPPAGFCFDLGCGDDPIMDDKRLHDNNVKQKVSDFLKAVKDQVAHYATEHIIMTMGSDFNYMSANSWYKNLDKLIKYVNAKQSNGSKVNLLYSTPSCYISSLHKAQKKWTTKGDDFFPYADSAHSFWTGYFTSRITLKRYSRFANNFMQVCKQLDVLAELGPEFSSDTKVDVLREALGVLQHHDGVSGTEKQAVAYDYAMRVANGINECQDVVNYAYSKLLPLNKGHALPQHFCTHLNVSRCNITETAKSFALTVYNPIARSLSSWVRIPVAGKAYTVTGPDGKAVATQMVPLSPVTSKLPEHNGSIATSDLLFQASLPALGFSTFIVSQTSSLKVKRSQLSKVYTTMPNEDTVIMNQYISLTFDGSTGLLKSMTNLASKITIPLEQSFLYYKAFVGNNSKPEFRASGAYVFRPDGNTPISIGSTATINIVKGNNVQEVHQVFGDWASQVVRLYDNSNHVEVEWTIGPIPIKDNVGKEVITLYKTGLESKGTFYTDANGREVLKRVRDYRPTWKLNQTEEVSGNYYPVNSRIFLRDDNKGVQFTVLTDRSHGGSSIQDGNLEIMVHRRCLHDDSFGVGEPLNETGLSGAGLIARGTHYLILDTIQKSGSQHRDLAEKAFMSPWLSFANLESMTKEQYMSHYRTMWSGVKTKLPDNVHLLTLEQWNNGRSILLRLEHFYEKTDDPVLSQPATVNIQNMFAPFTIVMAEELTLGGNQFMKEAKRFSWKTVDGTANNPDMSSYFTPLHGDNGLDITLNPMQIRTFKVTLRK